MLALAEQAGCPVPLACSTALALPLEPPLRQEPPALPLRPEQRAAPSLPVASPTCQPTYV